MNLGKKIEIKNLTWKPKANSKPVIKSINLLLEPGHIYGIIGPNGAGKTTLLRHILGILKTQGEIMLSDKPVKDFSARELSRELSFVPQRTETETDLTAEDIVMMGRNPYISRLRGESRQDIEAVRKALEAVGMSAYSQREFSSLSAGEAQKVIIARAIAQKTGWMLLDEPSANLDVKNQLEIMENLKQENKNTGLSVVAVLHDINLAAAYCDRIVMMKDGGIMCCADTEECLSETQLKALYGVDFLRFTLPDGKKAFYPQY